MPINRVHGLAKRIGEYHKNPITMLAIAQTSTAQKLIPSNE
jgi:hypothetical protein